MISARLRLYVTVIPNTPHRGSKLATWIADIQVDPGFVLYLAENLAVLEYKLIEEVMLVVSMLSALVTTAAPIVSVLEKAEIRGELNEAIEGKMLSLPEVGSPPLLVALVVQISVANLRMILRVASTLKASFMPAL